MKNLLLILLASLIMAGCRGGDVVVEKRAPPLKHKSAAGAGNTTPSHHCGHATRKGTPCKRKVTGTTGYCWQHDH